MDADRMALVGLCQKCEGIVVAAADYPQYAKETADWARSGLIVKTMPGFSVRDGK